MAINSTKSNVTGGKSLTYNQILSLFPANMNGAIAGYVRSKILSGSSVNSLFNQAEYLSYVESLGFTLELYNNNYYAKKVFTGSQSWTVPSEFRGLSAQVLVVAGGGAGGTNVGGGGGGGGLINNLSFITSESSYSVQVGSGGVCRTSVTSPGGTEASGTNSVFGSLVAIGGGGAGSYSAGQGATGGSGGGGSGWSGAYAGGAGTSGQGFAGGSGVGSNGSGGGGGGAGGVGNNGTTSGTPNTDVNGGPGLSVFGITYAAGGTGSGDNTQKSRDGAANSGNGGHGAGINPEFGGNGGSGIVIIRYLI